MPFLAARRPDDLARAGAHAAVTILGAPYDRTSSYRRGAAAAPGAIRWASESIETYSPTQDRDLDGILLCDAGDIDLWDAEPAAMVTRVRAAVTAAAGFPILLGGEHTVSVGAVQAMVERYPELAVVVVDAHTDLRDSYGGERWSHAATIRRISEHVGMDRIVMLGVRSGTRDEWKEARGLGYCGRTGVLPATASALLVDRPIYLSVDIDGFDPSVAAGTGNPEPLGMTVEEFMALLPVLRRARMVGCDVVEVSPPFDPAGQTSILAAWLVREMALAFSA
jgi:agmatinase